MATGKIQPTPTLDSLGLGGFRVITFAIAGNSSKTLTFENDSIIGALATSGAAEAKRGLYLVGSAVAGGPTFLPVLSASHISFSINNKIITVTNGAASYCFCIYVSWNNNNLPTVS